MPITPKTTNEPIRSNYPGDTHRVELTWRQRGDTFTIGVASWPASGPAPHSSDREAFKAMLPMLVARHAGEFVAIKDGQPVDHDRSRRALAQRFFAQHGDVAVYMPYIGSRRILRQATPFRTRPRA